MPNLITEAQEPKHTDCCHAVTKMLSSVTQSFYTRQKSIGAGIKRETCVQTKKIMMRSWSIEADLASMQILIPGPNQRINQLITTLIPSLSNFGNGTKKSCAGVISDASVSNNSISGPPGLNSAPSIWFISAWARLSHFISMLFVILPQDNKRRFSLTLSPNNSSTLLWTELDFSSWVDQFRPASGRG